MPRVHPLRKVEKFINYNCLHKQLDQLCYQDNRRLDTNSLALIHHLYSIQSLYQPYQKIQVNLAYRIYRIRQHFVPKPKPLSENAERGYLLRTVKSDD